MARLPFNPWVAAVIASVAACLLIGQLSLIWTAGLPLALWRVTVAEGVVVALVALVPISLLSPRLAEKVAGAREWAPAIAGTLALGALGLLVVGFYGLVPPPLEESHFKAWDYVDKRWLVTLYLLGAGLVYAPAFLHALLDGEENARPSDSDRINRARTRLFWRRTALAIVIGCVGALLYLAPFLPFGLERFMDPHEFVHLGGFQRIAQGAAPFLDSRTQYGPGYQLVTYWLMQKTGLSLYGFRLSQAWLNLAGAATLFSLWLGAYGFRRGALMILVSLALSPLLMITWWGWVIILRWVGPVLVGTLIPVLVWSNLSSRQRLAGSIAVAIACGILAWFAQENLTGPIITAILLLAAAYARRALTLGEAVALGAAFVGTQLLTFILLMIASYGLAGLFESLSLYFHSTGLVFQGFTNTNWSEPQSTWRRAYPATPFVVMLVTALALYARRTPNFVRERDYGLLLGMCAAAVPLTMITLFRADGPHFVTTATALPALLVLSLVILPRDYRTKRLSTNAIRIAMIAVFLVLYFNPKGNIYARTTNSRSFVDPRLMGNPTKTLDGIRRLVLSQAPVVEGDPISSKIGFLPRGEDRCCYVVPWTWQEWNETMRQAHLIANGRTVFVDVRPPLESSGIAFLADLRPASSYVSQMMSVWTDDDLRAVSQEFAHSPPDCILSEDPSLPITKAALMTYGNYTVTPVPGRSRLSFYCKTPEN